MGARRVPKFVGKFYEWAESLGPVQQWMFEEGNQEESNWLIPRPLGGGSFKFHKKDPIYRLGRRVTSRAGSLIIFDQRTAHGAQSNRSGNPRMMQFIKAFRRSPMTLARRQRRAASVYSEVKRADLLDLVTPLGGEVFGFEDVEEWQSQMRDAKSGGG